MSAPGILCRCLRKQYSACRCSGQQTAGFMWEGLRMFRIWWSGYSRNQRVQQDESWLRDGRAALQGPTDRLPAAQMTAANNTGTDVWLFQAVIVLPAATTHMQEAGGEAGEDAGRAPQAGGSQQHAKGQRGRPIQPVRHGPQGQGCYAQRHSRVQPFLPCETAPV